MDSWAFCQESLIKLSRSFSVPISMLPEELGRVVTCGYLLCRIADTIEDRPELDEAARAELFSQFLRTIEDEAPAARFEAAFASALSSEGDEAQLACNLGRVLGVLGESPARMRAICMQWVSEMTRGMTIYSRREPDAEGIVALRTMADLRRYCYFVAGTVGHMLTELFLLKLDGLPWRQEFVLRQHAEAFGAGLQLVNIVKDMAEDLGRGWCFVPQVLWYKQGLTPTAMRSQGPTAVARLHTAVEPVFLTAKSYLERAFRYSMAIPAAHTGIRLFCLVPLWLAMATLEEAYGNDALFDATRKVKISRQRLNGLVTECVELSQDDAGLVSAFDRLQDRLSKLRFRDGSPEDPEWFGVFSRAC